MKIEFENHYELKNFCQDFVARETDIAVEDLSRRLQASEEKVRELQKQKDALTGTDPQPFVDEHSQVLRALAKDHPSTLRTILHKLNPDNRISQIKMLRTIYGCGLKEGKEFVDGTNPALNSSFW